MVPTTDPLGRKPAPFPGQLCGATGPLEQNPPPTETGTGGKYWATRRALEPSTDRLRDLTSVPRKPQQLQRTESGQASHRASRESPPQLEPCPLSSPPRGRRDRHRWRELPSSKPGSSPPADPSRSRPNQSPADSGR